MKTLTNEKAQLLELAREYLSYLPDCDIKGKVEEFPKWQTTTNDLGASGVFSKGRKVIITLDIDYK